MRRTDLFLAFRHKNQIDRQLLARVADGMERSQEGGFRAFLIDGAAANEHLAKTRLIHQSRFKWWRRPLGGINLFYVIHIVNAQFSRRASVQYGKYTRLAIGRYFSHLGEPGLAQHLHSHFTAFSHTAVLGSY